MKVYATLLNDEGKVILKEWASAKSFLISESWTDPKFINVAKTSDLEAYEYLPARGGSFFIIHTPDQIASHKLLYFKFHSLRAKGAIK